MKRIICWLVAIILAVTAVFSCVSFAFAAEGPAELSLVFENCDPPEAGDLYAAEEDTTVRVADTAPAGGETIYYMLMFTLKNKETRMTERIAYTGTILLREAIAQAVADGVLTQEELDGVGVVFIDMTAGDEYDPVASGNARFMPATCKQVAFDQAAGEYPAGTQLGLSSGTADAQIYYTLDGTSPKLSSASLYNPANKLTLTEDVRILASARKAGLKSSEPASGAYTVHKSGMVTADPAPGTVAAGTQVTLRAAADEKILYTTDGTVPAQGAAGTTDSGADTAVVVIGQDTLINARTHKDGVAMGNVQRFSYTVGGMGDQYEPNDARETATDVSFPSKIRATIHSAADVDYYKFHYSYATPIELLLFQPDEEDAAYSLTLLRSDGSEVAASALAGDQRITAELVEGDYYAVVKSPDGAFSAKEYTLTISKQAAEGLDLSEYNMLNAMLNADSSEECYTPTEGRGGVLSGGDIYMALAYLARWSGPVLEEDDPYMLDEFGGDVSEFAYNQLPARYHLRQAILLPDREKTAEDTLHYKNAIYTYGAIYCGIRHQEGEGGYYDETGSYYFKPEADMAGGGHAISLVGWDDTVPAEQFTVTVDGSSYTPAGDGAFIAKNNYGTEKGQNGFFYISYYSADLSANPAAAIFVDNPSSDYDNIYQYDPLGYTNLYEPSQYSRGKVLYTKNVFTAAGAQDVKAVPFYSMHEDQDYDVYLEANGETRHVASGAHKYKGYYTVELGEGISVAAGEEFSVTVRLQNRDGSDVVAAIEMPIAGRSDRARAQAGQSFTSTDGRDWTDISAKYSANNCIKVFTDGAGGGTDDSSQGGVGRVLSVAQLERTGELSIPAAAPDSASGSGQNTTSSLPQGRTADPVTNLPEKFDLRDIGAVTPVKNQGWIPSCWTFATMSSAESILLRQNNIAEQMGVESVSIDGADSVYLEIGQTADFSATATVTPNEEVFSGIRWSYAGDLDSIDIRMETGCSGETAVLFTAKATGTVVVTATSTADDTKSVSKTITIVQDAQIPGAEGKEIISLPRMEDGLELEKIQEALNGLGPQQALLIPAEEGTIVPKEVFEQIKGQDKTVIFAILDDTGKVVARFVFYGGDITAAMDMSLAFSNTPGEAAKNAAVFPQGTKLLFLNFGHSGALPGKATISVLAVPPFGTGEETYLYYFNGTGYDDISTQSVDSAGYAAFTLEHCSEYVLANQKQPDSGGTADSGSGTQQENGTQQGSGAQTGDTKDMTLWVIVAIIAGAAVAAAVLIVLLRRRSGK